MDKILQTDGQKDPMVWDVVKASFVWFNEWTTNSRKHNSESNPVHYNKDVAFLFSLFLMHIPEICRCLWGWTSLNICGPLTTRGGTPSVKVSKDVLPFRPRFFFFFHLRYTLRLAIQMSNILLLNIIIFIFSHSLIWVNFVKCSYLTTLFVPFSWKFDTPVGGKITPWIFQLGWKFILPPLR